MPILFDSVFLGIYTAKREQCYMYAQGRILQNVFTNDHNYAHNDEKMQADKKGSSIFISGHERCLTRLRTSLQ